MKEIADTPKCDHQCVHVVVGDVKVAACSKRFELFCDVEERRASRNNVSDAHVVEQPLGLFQIFGEITNNGYLCEGRDQMRSLT